MCSADDMLQRQYRRLDSALRSGDFPPAIFETFRPPKYVYMYLQISYLLLCMKFV